MKLTKNVFCQIMNYQTPRKDDRRGGSMGKFSNKKQDTDGWMTPSNKNTRAQQQTFDIGKLKTVSASLPLIRSYYKFSCFLVH